MPGVRLVAARFGLPSGTRQPELSAREEFARRVMAAAVSGSVERVESLVDSVFSNTGPEAQQLQGRPHWHPPALMLSACAVVAELAEEFIGRESFQRQSKYASSSYEELLDEGRI